MTDVTMSIIGTAGRKEDGKRLRASHYPRMVEAARKLIGHLGIDLSTLQLCSGGAAWSDHVPVTLIREGLLPPDQLMLYMPTAITAAGFRGSTPSAQKTASTANHYHHIFSQMLHTNTLEEIMGVGNRGAFLVEGNGNFFARNMEVAKACSPDGYLLAYTFGSPDCTQVPWTIREYDWHTRAEEAGLKDGGTAHTWDNSGCRKFHCLLGD